MANTTYVGPADTRAAFSDKNTHPVVLCLLLLNKFGSEYLGWEPETLWWAIGKEYGGLSTANKTKIQSARTCLTTTTPYEHWNIFEPVANGLMGFPPVFEYVDRASPYRCAFSVTAMQNLRNDVKLGTQVWKYIAASLHDAGFVCAPGVLAPADKFLYKLTNTELHDKVLEAIRQGKRPEDNSAVALHVSKCTGLADFSSMWRRMMVMQTDKLVGE